VTWLDGNALAGTLRELFGVEMTLAMRDCRACGTRNALGAHRAYRSAGAVLRCPVCGDLALLLTSSPDGDIARLLGDWTLPSILA
jgi:Family of unknown function (DUF6510)